MSKKYYEGKKEHLRHIARYMGNTDTWDSKTVGYTFDSETEAWKLLFDAGVLEYWCREISKPIDPWFDPEFYINLQSQVSDGALGKSRLLIRMQSWADYHNKMDGFVADWGNDMQKKYGVVIEDRITSIQPRQTYNGYLFQICVGTESRAAIMHGYFHKDIQSLIDKGLI